MIDRLRRFLCRFALFLRLARLNPFGEIFVHDLDDFLHHQGMKMVRFLNRHV
jgi:hypothetical protein